MPDFLEPPATRPVYFIVTPFRVGWLALSLWLFMLLGYGVDRPQFSLVLTLYALLFWGYSRITQRLWFNDSTPDRNAPPDRFLFGAAVLVRIALIAMVPNLSDDYVRFLWDGHLVAHGANPYDYLPSQLVGTPFAQTAGLTDALFNRLHLPDTITRYLPVCQALFGLAAGLFPHNELGALITLRLLILLAELGTLWLLVGLLRRFGQNPNQALLYALNPLVVLELTGNLHVEAVMLFFVLLAIWLFGRKQRAGSAVALALSLGVSWLPLLLFPLLRQLGWQRGFVYVAQTLVLTALLYVPFLSPALLPDWLTGPNVLGQDADFNASVYSLVQRVGHWSTGDSGTAYAGLGLRLIALLGAVYLAFRLPVRPTAGSLATSLLLTLTLYWLLSPTVYPWAIIPLLIPALFTPFRYPLVWSALIVLAYAAYQTQPYRENSWFVALEYAVVVGYGLREWRRLRDLRSVN